MTHDDETLDRIIRRAKNEALEEAAEMLEAWPFSGSRTAKVAAGHIRAMKEPEE